MVKILIELYRRIKYRRYGWFGNYSNWDEASAQCTGYDAGNILQKIVAAAVKVRNGEAVYERDGVLFDQTAFSWPLLAHLLWIAQQNNGRLRVIDFGGSLGSTYFQNRKYLDNLEELAWSIIEQPSFIEEGRAKIAGGPLQFYFAIEEAIAQRGEHDVLLISCVLPYIQKPYDLLHEVAHKKFSYIIIENTYFNTKPSDRLTIQKVPPFYYEASYPAWFLHYDKVKQSLQPQYEVMQEYINDQFLYFYGEKINYRGIVLKRVNE